jgi:hypothetical protein
LDAYPSVVKLPATRLPPAPASVRVERAFLIALFEPLLPERVFAPGTSPKPAWRVR